jgi:hypothetical protein
MVESTRTDGGWEPRREGKRYATGWVVSPILSNLFLHYAFDMWMRRNQPHIPFERYADDVICHCRSEEQARTLRASLEMRFAECGLTLHPDKTKVVYCKDDDRRGDYPDHKFDFLGYTFRPRLSRRRNGFGVSFSPAVSAVLPSPSSSTSSLLVTLSDVVTGPQLSVTL